MRAQILGSKLIRFSLGVVVVLLLGWAYVAGAARQGRMVNTTIENTDQASYLEYAANIYHNGASYIGNRNQMPLYPFLHSLLYDPQLSIDASFERGKTFNVALSLVLLVGLGVLLWRSFPALQAAALLLVSAFTVFVFRAPYVQVELLYYVLALGTFLLLCRMLERPSWPLALTSGLAVAVTHLTKAGVLPALLLFAAFGVARASWLALRARGSVAGGSGDASRLAMRETGMVVLVAAVFVTMISPYLVTSERVFGDALYNANSTFYMWYDTWADARAGTIRAGDKFGWPALPEDSLPSLRRYLGYHTPGQIVDRFADGVRYFVREGVRAYGYWKYVVFYFLAALIAVGSHWRWALDRLRGHAFVIAFATSYLVGYGLLYAWYVPIAAGNRLVLALFLPFMYSAGRVLSEQASHERESTGRRYPWLFTLVHVAIIAGLALELHDILTDRIVTVYGGR
jgi:hypothetical protein